MSDETEADARRRLCDPLAPDPVTWGRDKDLERIAALEATVARLTAEVTDEEAVAVNIAAPWFGRVRVAMDAFLERRMKG